MICPNCHAYTKDGSAWCSNCGYQLPLYKNPEPSKGPELPDNHTYGGHMQQGDQGSYSEYRKRMEQQQYGTYEQPGTEPAVQIARERCKPEKTDKRIFGLKQPVFFAAAGAALALIVAVILLLTLGGQRNLGKIEVCLKHGDLVVGEVYSDKEIQQIIDDGGYTDGYNPNDGVRKLHKKYGLADDPYNNCELWFHKQDNGWIFYRAAIGRKGYGIENIIVGNEFSEVLQKYPDFAGNLDLSSGKGAEQWHLHLDENGKVVSAYVSLLAYHEDPDDFNGIVIRVILDSTGEIVYITVAQYNT